MFSAFLLLASAHAAGQTSDATSSTFDGLEPIVHLRTYYWDSQTTKGVRSEAAALGGWIGAKTRWYGDLLQLGVLGYTSQKLYGPADKDGSQLLGPGQQAINVVGQAYASLRGAGQTFTGYRQMINQPWVNPQDSRMIPSLFEGYLLAGIVGDLEYTGGYVTKMKTRDSDTFEWMSNVAKSKGSHQGMVLLGARLPIAGNGDIRIAEQYLADAYNTAYADAEYPLAIGDKGRLRLRGQYANQQSVGSAGLGSFNTWMYGLGGIYERGPLSVQLAWTQTSSKHETLSPFGDNPSYLHLMQIDFNKAGEKAWLIGCSFHFAAWGAPGLNASVTYGNGYGSIDPNTGAPIGSRNETNLKLAYALEKSSRLHGLSFGVEGSWLNQVGEAAQGRQLRVFANYAIPFNLGASAK